MKFDAEEQEKADAELGYSVRGEREVRLREWMSVREEGEAPGDFDRLVGRLRQRKYWKNMAPASKARIRAYRKQWAAENKERYQAAVNRCKRQRRKLKTPGFVREMEARRALRLQERIARHAAAVFVCVVCGAQWCASLLKELPRAHAPKYCTQTCRSRAGYLRARAAGKR